ncbi:MAG: hypothetical protein E6R09_19300 [Rhodocyclaceae bacterium]|nr:MAG: hypothetical protein E6R09_19300 [Rhodocyclaceae bacterium]
MSEAYHRALNASIADRDAFWSEAANALDWITPPQTVYDAKEGWFKGGTLNTAYNSLDRHIAAGRGDAVALIYDSPATDQIKQFTYSELLEESGRVAAMLRRLDVKKGDRAYKVQ